MDIKIFNFRRITSILLVAVMLLLFLPAGVFASDDEASAAEESETVAVESAEEEASTDADDETTETAETVTTEAVENETGTDESGTEESLTIENSQTEETETSGESEDASAAENEETLISVASAEAEEDTGAYIAEVSYSLNGSTETVNVADTNSLVNTLAGIDTSAADVKVTFLSDVKSEWASYEIPFSLEIDLNGKNVYLTGLSSGTAFIVAENSDYTLTVSDSSESNTGVLKTDGAVFQTYAGTKLIINGGTFISDSHVVASEGELVINGGNFESATAKSTIQFQGTSAYISNCDVRNLYSSSTKGFGAALELLYPSNCESFYLKDSQLSSSGGGCIYFQSPQDEVIYNIDSCNVVAVNDAIYVKNNATGGTINLLGDTTLYSESGAAVELRKSGTGLTLNFSDTVKVSYSDTSIPVLPSSAVAVFPADEDGNQMVLSTEADTDGYYSFVTAASVVQYMNGYEYQGYQYFGDFDETLASSEEIYNAGNDDSSWASSLWKAFKTAYENALAVKDNTNANQNEIDYFANELAAALLDLKESKASAINFDSLLNGDYNVNVSMWNIGFTNYSMANGAMNEDAVLHIGDDGASVTLTFHPTTALFTVGAMTNLWVYEGESFEAGYANRVAGEGRAEGTYGDWYTYAIDDEENLTYTTAAAEEDADGARPASVTIPLYYLGTDSESRKICVRISVDVMTEMGVGDQDAILYLDYSSISAVTDTLSASLRVTNSDGESAEDAITIAADNEGDVTRTVTLLQAAGSGYVLSLENSNSDAVSATLGEAATESTEIEQLDMTVQSSSQTLTIAAAAGLEGTKTATLTLTATNGSDTLTKTIEVTVSSEKAVKVESVTVEDATATATLSGGVVAENDTVAASGSAVTADATTGNADVTAVNVIIPQSVAAAVLGDTAVDTYSVAIYQDGTTTKSMADGCMGDATVTLSGTTYTVSIPLTSITMDYGDSTCSGTISDIKIEQASDCDVINNTLVFTVSSDDFAELTFDATMSVTVTAISGSGGYTHDNVAADIVLSKASSMLDGYSSLVLATDVGSVTLDSAILEGITETATLTIAVNSTYSSYTDGDGHVFVCGYDLTLSTDFNGGTATVSVPCESTDVVYAYCIDDDGSLAERAALTVVSGYASWSTTHFSTWALSENEYKISSGSTSGGSSGGSSSSTSSSFLNTDGNYLVTITLYKESANEESMGDVAFEYNRSALVTVSGGEITYVEIATNPVKVDLYVSAMTALALTNGGDVEVLERGDFSTSYNGTTTKTYEDDNGYIKRASFDMPNEGQPSTADSVTYVNVTFTVPDTPMDDLYETLAARIQFDWSTATKTSKSHLTANTSTATGSSSSGGTATTVEDISLTDSATGIKLETNTNRLDSEAELRVTVVTEGDDYDNAASLMGTDDEWTLYEIVALVDGTVTAPSGSVTLYIPCTDEEGLTVYRINDSGRTVIKGSVSGSYYTFTTSSLGLFAIIGSVADADEIVQVSESGFTDIVGHWAEEYIETVVQRGLFNGTGETTFDPDSGLTRGMFVTVLGRLYGIDTEAEFTNAFDDVDAEAYYALYIAWASENGLVNGTGNGTFEPDREITRQEMATIMSRYFEFAEITPLDSKAVSYADDADIADWAREGVEGATKAGLFSGTDKNEFNPLGTATRAEAATVFARLIGSYGL